MFKKNYNLWCFKLLTGKIHHYWLMVYQSSSQLFWRNHAMVWFVHICFFCLQRMAVFGCTQSIVCAFAYHQTKWYSIAGKGRLEKMGTLEGVSRIFEKYTFFGAFLEINVYWRATLSREKARKIQNSVNKKWTISDFYPILCSKWSGHEYKGWLTIFWDKSLPFFATWPTSQNFWRTSVMLAESLLLEFQELLTLRRSRGTSTR